MTTTAGANIFKGCNVSEDIIKRYSNIKKDKPTSVLNVSHNKISMHSTSASSKKADLERLLLSVPLTDDVASFSDNDNGTSQARKFPLYADHMVDDVSVYLPSSGYKSAPEGGGGKYKIRTNSKAQKLPLDCSGDNKKSSGEVKRTSSLRASSVTDRVEMFRDKLSKSNSIGNSTTKLNGVNKNRGYEAQKSALKSSSLGSVSSSLNKWNNTSTRQQTTEKTNNDVSPLQRKVFGKGRPTNKSNDSWEVHQPTNGNGKLDTSIVSRSKSFSDTEECCNQPSYRRERRLKRGAQLKAHQCEKSDSETEPEDGHLTKACLDRLDRRNKNAALRGRRGRIDKNNGGTQDENNNETSSDKTLDSGVFDLYLHNVTEDMNKLLQRYDSKEFLLDDTLSLKSGYSSASDSLADSIADSVTTIYDSNDEHQQWDGNKSRIAHKNKTKSIITNMNKYAVTNASCNANKPMHNNIKSHQTTTNSSNTSFNKHSTINSSHNTDNQNTTRTIVPPDHRQSKGTLGTSRIPMVDNNKRTESDLKNVNKDASRKFGSSTTDTQVKSSANSLNKYTNPHNDVQLATRNIKDTKQLKSNTFGHDNLKTSNEAEKTIELDSSKSNDDNSKYNKRNNNSNLSHGIPQQSNSSKDNIDDLNKQILEKKSNLKTASKLKDLNNNDTLDNTNLDKNNNTINSNHSGKRGVINGHHRNRDESDGGKHRLEQQNTHDTKKDIHDKSTTDNSSDSKIQVKRNIPSHLTKKSLTKQGSTELSLLPTTRIEPIKIEKKPTPRVNDKNVETIHKGIQCDLLLDADLVTVAAVPVSTKLTEHILRTDALDLLGQQLLDDIQFKYPENFMLSEDLSRFTTTTNEEGEIVVSNQLKMDNARLQKLLVEVERARSGTIKALLHVNTLLNKVQIDNAKLKSDMEVSLQEKEILKENLKEAKDQAKPVNSKIQSTSNERWKRDKIELMTQLEKSKNKAEEADRELLRLRAQYKKVKEQLEHSNNAFTTTLKNNLDATKRLESELQTSLEEKQALLTRCNEGSKLKIELDAVKEEIEEVKNSHEELQDEKDQLEEKIRHLEKKRQQLLDEQEELQEQISHSQEIIEKLSDAGETLKDRLQKEIKEKEYLQECLEETGQILYQLKINERKLLEDKNVLQYELETEAEEKEQLASSLSKTKTEHQDLIDRLQNMTNIHLTVKESLQLANKKEKNYQEQIEALTKTNHILHYTLEKEKEERIDLQEMMEIIELNYKKMKDQTVGKERENEQKVGRIADENQRLMEINALLEKKCCELAANIEKETESKRILEEKLKELEKVKDEVENTLEVMRDKQVENEKNMDNSIKARQELEEHLKIEQEKVARLTKSLEQTKKMLEQVDFELNEARRKLEQFKCNQTNLEEKTKESRACLKELETTVQELTEARDKYFNRMNYYETETKQLRTTVSDQTDEVGGLILNTQRLTRERDKLKRNVETAHAEFESHKLKCGETLKRLKNEVIELSSKLVEKGRIVMKHKENVDNSKSDLEVLRKILDTNVTVTVNKIEKNMDDNSTDIEKINLQILRDTHDKFRVEFQSHVEKLEDMLKDSKISNDSITVVQSPMSKIKLEEIKFLRSETFELHTDVTSVKRQLSKLEVEFSDLKLGLSGDNNNEKTSNDKVSDDLALEVKLSKLNELTTQIECRHHAVMNQNSLLLEKTLLDDDVTSKDLVRKFKLVSMQGENRQLKSFIGLLQKKYNFTEEDLADELKTVSAGDKISMSDLISIANEISNTTKEINTSVGIRGPEIILTTPPTPNNESSRNEHYVHSESRRNKTLNLFNQILTANPPLPSSYLMTKTYSKSFRSACSTPSYCSDEEDIFNLPRRYHSVPRSRSRPRSSYS